MKKIFKDKIINIDDNKFDNKFLVPYLDVQNFGDVKIYDMQELLKEKENKDLWYKVKDKPAIYSNIYSPKDELEIFEELFNNALEKRQKIHIIGISLLAEIDILEKYYEELGFLREDINCFDVDFSVPLVTVSVKIENLMWKGSDYKRMKDKIFFIPPPRESSQNKAMFKGITRGVTAGIYINNFGDEAKDFLEKLINEEKVLPLQLGKILNYNLSEIGFTGKEKDLIIEY
ncbi:MAG: hypothetical protein N4A38_03500 [Candidatus Gracilibacteria bacterium]|nr:hypothetical protein [Candidatus Gracilibacteria bacterium]